MTASPAAVRLRNEILPPLLSSLLYVAAYLVVDAPAFSFDIRPGIAGWSLPAALSLALLVVRGPHYAPLVLAASMLSGAWHGELDLTWAQRFAAGLGPALMYAATGWLLRRSYRPLSYEPTVRHAVRWLLVVGAGAGLASAARYGVLIAAGAISVGAWQTPFMALWMGEAAGIVSVVPFLVTFVLSSLPEEVAGGSVRIGWASLSQPDWGRAAWLLAEFAGLVASLLVVFTPRAEGDLALLYPLFLPLMWLSVHYGLQGAVAANLGLIAGSMLLFQRNGLVGIDILELQAFLLTLAVTGLLLGSALSDERHTRGRLQQQETRYQEVQRRKEVAEGMRDILAMINSKRPLKEILDAIAEQAAELLGSETVSIFLLDPEGQTLSVAASRGIPMAMGSEVRVPLGSGAVGKAVQERRPVVVRDLERLVADTGEDPHLESERKRAEWLVSEFSMILSVPLLARQRPLGGMSLYYKAAREISEAERELAMIFATQAALALDNAHLYLQAQELAVLQERQRLARELHDSVSQALYGISLGARTARAFWERDRDDLDEPLEYIQSLADAGLAEMRALIFELRPESLEKEGLTAVLDRLSTAFAGRHDLRLQTKFDPEPDVPMPVKEAFYRIAQEALNNTSKHARAERIEVALTQRDGDLQLVVEDDGQGFDPTGDYPGHLGLRSMHERAEGIGAELTVHSTSGRGTRVEVRWSAASETAG